jgi:hypothetical protein
MLRALLACSPRNRQVVEAFFATQLAEDAGGYLAFWRAKAQRPQLQQLQFIFEFR